MEYLVSLCVLCTLSPSEGVAAPRPIDGDLSRLPLRAAPLEGEPARLKSAPGAPAITVRGAEVIDLKTGRPIFTARGQSQGYVPSALDCALKAQSRGAKPTLSCGLITERRIKKQGFKKIKGRRVKVSYTLSHWRVYAIEEGTYRLLAERKDQADLDDIGTRWRFQLLGVTYKGARGAQVFFREVKRVAKWVRKRGKQRRSVSSKARDLRWRSGQGKATVQSWPGAAPQVRSSGAGFNASPRLNPALQFATLGGRLCYGYSTSDQHGPLFFACDGDQKARRVMKEAMYDFRFTQGGDGWIYLSAHEPEDENFLLYFSKDGRSWQKTVIDSKESGWQHEASVHGDRVCLLSFFFRNIFNKGLTLSCHVGGRQEGAPVTIVRARAFNTGWYPHFTFDGAGGVWLSYWRRVPERERVWSYLPSLEALRKQSARAPSILESFYKPWALQAGAGVWYTSWDLWSLEPAEEDRGGVDAGEDRYRVRAALLTVASFEGKFFGTQLAMSYAESISEEATESLAGDERTSLLTGQLEMPSPLPGHDVQVRYKMGRYEGSMTRKVAGAEERRRVDTLYHDAAVAFLNKWRVFYGFAFTQYALPMTLHGWYVAPEADPVYLGGTMRDVDVSSIRATFGYSTLDYASKYETGYSGLFFDLQLDGGVARLTFDPISYTPGGLNGGGGEGLFADANAGGDPVEEESLLTFDVRVNASLGYLWMQRWAALAGFGIYLRPAYRAEAGLLGFPSAGDPGEADEDPALRLQPGLASLRHGPWLDIGLVW
ncbi:MAG: hypothetical protein VYD19_05055 [Myxococcota bacterium]|nr:hypothetical protein [Myxococcota bacterium]